MGLLEWAATPAGEQAWARRGLLDGLGMAPQPPTAQVPVRRAPETPAPVPASAPAVSPGYRNVLERLDVPVNPNSRNVLPYADDRIAANVQSFFDDARAQGMDLQLNDAFRTHGLQAAVTGNKNGGVAPGHSHHEAGYAFDVDWNRLSGKQQRQLLDIAAKHKFKWGGNFKKPDLVHFYADPPQPLKPLIQQAQDGFWGEM